MRPNNRRKHIVIGLALVLSSISLIWLGGFIWYTLELPTEIKDQTTKTDAVVVLTGGSDRLESGLDILAAGNAKKLFVSGVHQLTSVALLQRVLKREPKIFECCVILGKTAENTVGNAAETALWMHQEGYRSLRMVTAAYHMPRSLFEFRRVMPNTVLIAHPVFPAHVKLSDWWRWGGTTYLIATEFSKLMFTLIWARLGNGLAPNGSLDR